MLSRKLDHVGAFARSLSDLALVLDVIAAARQRAHDHRLVGGRVLDQQQFEQWCHNTRNEMRQPRRDAGGALTGRAWKTRPPGCVA